MDFKPAVSLCIIDALNSTLGEIQHTLPYFTLYLYITKLVFIQNVNRHNMTFNTWSAFEFIAYITPLAVGICLLYFFLRWVFKIGTLVKHSKLQSALLKKIAERHGVSKDEIDGIEQNIFHER